MLMLRLRLIIIGALGVIVLATSIAYMVRRHLMDATTALDRDFVATISFTKTPLVFDYEVRKVNKHPRKQIYSPTILMDFALKDRTGRVFASDNRGTQRYARFLGEDPFDDFGPHPSDSVTGKVRLLTARLKPGVYEVEPRVLIREIGPDRVTNPPANGSPYVAIPAGNSVKVTIK